MDAIAYDSRLPQQITGTVAVPEQLVERALGYSAYLTWQILCAHRNAEGMTTITIAGMRRTKRFETLSPVQIKKALIKLRSSGLVRDLVHKRIRMQRPVGRQGKTAEVWAFPRRIYGCRAVGPGGGMVLVPGQVWRWVKARPGRGGVRKGAGRPRTRYLPNRMRNIQLELGKRFRSSVRAAVRACATTGYVRKSAIGFPDYRGIIEHLGPCPGVFQKYHIDHIRPLAYYDLTDPVELQQAFAPANHQWLPAAVNLQKSAQWDGKTSPGNSVKLVPLDLVRGLISSSSPGKNAWAGPNTVGDVDAERFQKVPYARSSRGTPDIYNRSVAAFDVCRDVASRASLGMPHSAFSADGPILKMATTPVGGNVGSRIGGVGRPPPPPGKMGVPLYPGPTVCPPAMIPGPPLLPDEIDDLDAADWLAKAFRGAVASRYKKRCWSLGSRDKLKKSKHLKLLVEAAGLLREYGVPPAAWAAFSVDQWRRNEMGKGQPRPNWVFSIKRIEDQHGWGRREGYAAKRAVYSKPAQDLMRRYKCMRVALAQSGAQTRVEVAVVVEQWFPNGLYEQLQEKARARAVEDQLLINQRAARGEWMGW